MLAVSHMQALLAFLDAGPDQKAAVVLDAESNLYGIEYDGYDSGDEAGKRLRVLFDPRNGFTSTKTEVEPS